ncbi:MAG: hypothetical protein H0X30_31845 [Anaerolineae bacterium]|nr:hypothetical protein [Anaerolineae bacterium]
MEILRGKCASFLDVSGLAERIKGYDNLHIDIGTGDGRFVQHRAQACPNDFVMGVDACRENLTDTSRRVSSNALFMIANAQALPFELCGLATQITINFPWGSLLESLLVDDAALFDGLGMIAQANATLDVRLNGGALAEAGWSFEEGASQVQNVLAANGFKMRTAEAMSISELKMFPTTWAKRIAFGRDPRAVHLRGE